MKKGETELIVGPMFSGKTSELFRRVRRAVVAGRNVCLIKWKRDVRSGRAEMTSSHDGEYMRCIQVDSLLEDPSSLDDSVDFVAVDEGQFLDGLSEFCQRQNELGRDVVVAALNHVADQRRTPWPNVVSLQSWAFCTHLSAICLLCQRRAACSRRIEEQSNQSVCIGGADLYIATCANCYTRPILPQHVKRHDDAMLRIKKIKA